ncbi:molybdopterin biosynthesis protein MoeB [Rhodococcus gordoniae]|uniref:Molybdopterin biosynthesis protein MoeB n=1 Tax=Rhodococcus gordoniae TaxID=223392 RepID=A0A379M2A2_9NOCA|nr:MULTISPECIES: rhodanese-like domain-containing protein [Rhodococcus]UTT49050.1 rhodanese-like domain-containing protein [Rhodococcus gordoniae]SUE16449.1 molybdopterin biosynthesis protein MoeB [Rhodococcus gordoniae]
MRVALLSASSVSTAAPVAFHRLAVERTYPTELAAAVARGAVVVDIRSHAERAAQGTLPGALAISADLVAERLDPSGSGRLALAVDRDVEWILVSSDGASSHGVVAGLHAQGLRRVTHLVGGYDAIRAARLVGAVAEAQHVAQDVARVTAH